MVDLLSFYGTALAGRLNGRKQQPRATNSTAQKMTDFRHGSTAQEGNGAISSGEVHFIQLQLSH